MAEIFLSYASTDRERVRLLVERLGAAGWDVWWDREIPLGSSWPEVLEERIARASITIVVWSEHSVQSKWVRIESREAARRAALVPVFIDHVAPPLEFSEIQGADLSAWNGDDDHPAWRRLLTRLAGATSSSPAEERAPSEKRSPSVPGDTRASPTGRSTRARRVAPVIPFVVVAALGIWRLAAVRFSHSAITRPMVAVLPVLAHDEVSGSQAERFGFLLVGEIAADSAWEEAFLAVPHEIDQERRMRDAGMLDTAGAIVPGGSTEAATIALATRLHARDGSDSLLIEMLLFDIRSGVVKGTARKSAEPLGFRSAIDTMLQQFAVSSSDSRAGAPDSPPDAAGVAALGEALLDLQANDITAAAATLARGDSLAHTYAPLARAAAATRSFLSSPLPAVAVEDFHVSVTGSTKLTLAEAGKLGPGVSNMLTAELANRAGLRVLERGPIFLKTLLEERNLHDAGRVDSGTAIRPGKGIQTRYFVNGDAGVVRDTLDIEAQVRDAESSRIVIRVSRLGALTDLFDLVVEVGKELGDSLTRRVDLRRDDVRRLADLLGEFGLESRAAQYHALAVGRP